MLVPISEQGNSYLCLDTSKKAGSNACTVEKSVVDTQRMLSEVEKRVFDIAINGLTWGVEDKPLYAFLSLRAQSNKAEQTSGWGITVKKWITVNSLLGLNADENLLPWNLGFTHAGVTHNIEYWNIGGTARYVASRVGIDMSTGFPLIYTGELESLSQVVGIGAQDISSYAMLNMLLGTTLGQTTSEKFNAMLRKVRAGGFINAVNMGEYEEKFISYLENGALTAKKATDIDCVMNSLVTKGTNTGDWLYLMLYLALNNALVQSVNKYKWLGYTINLDYLYSKYANNDSMCDEALQLFGITNISKLIKSKDSLVTIRLTAQDTEALYNGSKLAVELESISKIQGNSLLQCNNIVYHVLKGTKIPKNAFGPRVETQDIASLSGSESFIVGANDDWDVIFELLESTQYGSRDILVNLDELMSEHRLNDFLVWSFSNKGRFLLYPNKERGSKLFCVKLVTGTPELMGDLTFSSGSNEIKKYMEYRADRVISGFNAALDKDISDRLKAQAVKAFLEHLELERFNGSTYEVGVEVSDLRSSVSFSFFDSANYYVDTPLSSEILLFAQRPINNKNEVAIFDNRLYNLIGLAGCLNNLLVVCRNYGTGSQGEKSLENELARYATNITDKLVTSGTAKLNALGQIDVSALSRPLYNIVKNGANKVQYTSPDLRWLNDYKNELIQGIKRRSNLLEE